MEDREFSGINVVPLVDVMLVLLTITLVTATFIRQGELPVNLPSSEDPESGRTHLAIEITLTREGKVFLKNREISIDQLDEALKGLDRQASVNLLADRDLRIQSFVRVMEVLNRLEFREVRLIVKRDGF